MSEGEAIAYVTITAKREAYRLITTAQRETAVLDAMENYEPAAVEIDHDQLMDAIDALDVLSDLQRKAVYAVHVIGLSYREAMEALGWSYTQVNRHLSEGMKRIRDNRKGGE